MAKVHTIASSCTADSCASVLGETPSPPRDSPQHVVAFSDAITIVSGGPVSLVDIHEKAINKVGGHHISKRTNVERSREQDALVAIVANEDTIGT